MSGVVALFGLNNSLDQGRPAEIRLAAAMDALQHRGPDDRDYWISPDRRSGLGFNRLSVVDSQSGRQPIVNESRRLALAMDGELYEFERIRAELVERGHRFATGSDSEIALHLYEDHGVACLERLRGEFAFAICDRDQDLLFAARDRFGIKPLYYTVWDGVLLLASEVKALFAAGVPAVWDEEAYASRSFQLRDRTLYRGVRQIPPGHFLIAVHGGIHVLPYWDFDYPQAGAYARELDEPTAIVDVREELTEAIRLRLHADRPVGVYLSGGLGSSTLLGMATEIAGRPLDAFTLSVGDDAHATTSHARLAADHSGARLHFVRVSQSDLADHLATALWHSEQPFWNVQGVANLLLSRSVRGAGVKSVLTGEGADEIFGGYRHFERDMVLHNTEGQDPAAIGPLRARLPSAPTADLRAVLRRIGLEPGWMVRQSAWFRRLEPVLHPGLSGRGTGDPHPFDSMLSHVDIHGQLSGREPVHVAMYLWAKSLLPNFVLSSLGDRMEMSHSIEGRLPFLDHQVVESVTRLPVHMKIRGSVAKYLLRELARDYLPRAVWRRRKKYDRPVPAALSCDHPLYRMAQDTLRGNALHDVPFFDTTRVTKLLDRLPGLPAGERRAYDSVIMELLSFCLLQQQFRPGTA